MSISHKVLKYTYKFSVDPKPSYLQKIAYHLINSGILEQRGGNDKKIERGNLKSLLDYLEDIINVKNQKTERKYFVILYGPPASGKTVARKIACHLINSTFNERDQNGTNMNDEEIFNTFIDTGVDELTYDVISTIDENPDKKTVEEVLQDRLKNIIPDNIEDVDYKKRIVRDHIDELVNESFKIYRRDRADNVSELLYYLSVFLDMNIFFETASGSADYIDKVLENLGYYNYIPVTIYPFIKDVNILYNRSIERGLKEGRFIKCGGDYGITNNMKVSLEQYPKLKEIIRSKDEYIIYMYNAEFPSDIFDQINKYKFEELSNYLLESYQAEIVNEDVYKNRKILHQIHNDFDKRILMNTECDE